jgi:hypothetical protein
MPRLPLRWPPRRRLRWLPGPGLQLLAAGCSCWLPLLAAGCCLLAAGRSCWLQLLAAGCGLLAAAAGGGLLAAGCWLLAAGCWLLPAGRNPWLLAAGCRSGWPLAAVPAGCSSCWLQHGGLPWGPLAAARRAGAAAGCRSC